MFVPASKCFWSAVTVYVCACHKVFLAGCHCLCLCLPQSVSGRLSLSMFVPAAKCFWSAVTVYVCACHKVFLAGCHCLCLCLPQSVSGRLSLSMFVPAIKSFWSGVTVCDVVFLSSTNTDSISSQPAFRQVIKSHSLCLTNPSNYLINPELICQGCHGDRSHLIIT